MCGRKACTLDPELIAKKLNAKFADGEGKKKDWKPSYNVAPTTFNYVIHLDKNGERVVRLMKWGLVPSFAKKGSQMNANTINARSETLPSSPIWRRLINTRRCVVPATGYYEWKKEGTKKRPFFIKKDAADEPVYFAGLYDVHVDESTGEKLYSYTIVTMDAPKSLDWLHDRVPVMLDTQEKVDAWLHVQRSTPQVDHDEETDAKPLATFQSGLKVAAENPGLAFDAICKLCIAPVEKGIQCYEVSDHVGSVRNNSPENIKPLAEVKKAGIGSFFVKKDSSPANSPVKEGESVVKREEEMKPPVKRDRDSNDDDVVEITPVIKREKK